MGERAAHTFDSRLALQDMQMKIGTLETKEVKFSVNTVAFFSSRIIIIIIIQNLVITKEYTWRP